MQPNQNGTSSKGSAHFPLILNPGASSKQTNQHHQQQFSAFNRLPRTPPGSKPKALNQTAQPQQQQSATLSNLNSVNYGIRNFVRPDTPSKSKFASGQKNNQQNQQPSNTNLAPSRHQPNTTSRERVAGHQTTSTGTTSFTFNRKPNQTNFIARNINNTTHLAQQSPRNNNNNQLVSQQRLQNKTDLNSDATQLQLAGKKNNVGDQSRILETSSINQGQSTTQKQGNEPDKLEENQLDHKKQEQVNQQINSEMPQAPQVSQGFKMMFEAKQRQSLDRQSRSPQRPSPAKSQQSQRPDEFNEKIQNVQQTHQQVVDPATIEHPIKKSQSFTKGEPYQIETGGGQQKQLDQTTQQAVSFGGDDVEMLSDNNQDNNSQDTFKNYINPTALNHQMSSSSSFQSFAPSMGAVVHENGDHNIGQGLNQVNNCSVSIVPEESSQVGDRSQMSFNQNNNQKSASHSPQKPLHDNQRQSKAHWSLVQHNEIRMSKKKQEETPSKSQEDKEQKENHLPNKPQQPEQPATQFLPEHLHQANQGSERTFDPSAWSINDFEIGKALGRGKFGHVYLARTRAQKFICVLKVLYKSQLIKANQYKQLYREVEMGMHLKHKNIARMYGFFEDQDKVYLILEFCAQGELYHDLQEVQQSKKYSEPRAANYVYQVCEALEYAHAKDVIHRDIKPENLLNDFGTIKLSDWGWSCHAPSGNRKTFCGTPDYVPPEMVRSQGYGSKNNYQPHMVYDKRVDIWSIGVLTYEFLTSKPAFEHRDQKTSYHLIADAKYEFPLGMSYQAKDFIKGCLKPNPNDRFTLDQIKNHPWMQQRQQDPQEYYNCDSEDDSD